MNIVTPSRWLAQCVRDSVLMQDWPVRVIPNSIDTERWKPLDKCLARDLMNLPLDVPLVLFGAIGGGQDPRKGFDHLIAALQHLRGDIPEIQLLVFGQLAPMRPNEFLFPTHYTGRLYDDLSLRALYSAADVFVLPSRQDNLPNTGLESLSCGTPVVAFDTCGMPDIVCHLHSGYLAKPFDSTDLANGISWALKLGDREKIVRNIAREHAVKCWSYDVVSALYIDLYKSVVHAK